MTKSLSSRIQRELRWLFYCYKVWRRFFSVVVDRLPVAGVWRTLRAVLRGYAGDKPVLYGVTCLTSDDYLSDYERECTTLINPPSARTMLDDKLLFYLAVRSHARVPRVLMYAHRGQACVLEDVAAFVHGPANGKRLVVKPRDGGAGRGVEFARVVDGNVRFRDETMSVAAFVEKAARLDDIIVTEHIEQSRLFGRIYGQTTNTVRVLCMRDPQTQEPFIATAVMRIGTRLSGGVDNFSAGGISAPIDPDSGTMGVGIGYPLQGGPLLHFDSHPESGAAIAGERVPCWDEVRAASLGLMRTFPFLLYVGWDVVPCDDGPVFLEGNHYSGVKPLQVHQGLLADPRARAFYAFHRHRFLRNA